jgi:hypothetical protein
VVGTTIIGIGATLTLPEIVIGGTVIVAGFVIVNHITDNANKVDVDISNQQNNRGLNVGSWSDWEYKKFRDTNKWVRESDDETETWEIDEGHGPTHINNRIYDKKKLKEIDDWKESRDGPRPPKYDPKSGPDDHTPYEGPKDANPKTYRQTSKSSSSEKYGIVNFGNLAKVYQEKIKKLLGYK